MKFILHDWHAGSDYWATQPGGPVTKVEMAIFDFENQVGTKKNPIWEKKSVNCPYVEFATLEELLDFIQNVSNIMIRKPVVDDQTRCPHWRIFTSVTYGDFKQR
jgi:hypothetical protein